MAELSREQKLAVIIGVSLIALGIGFLLLQIVGVKSAGSWVPLLAGAIAMTLAISTRIPGFTILGCLLTFSGAGLLFYLRAVGRGDQRVADAVFLLCISAGFCGIPLLTRIIDRRILIWPLIPGVIGLFAGMVLLF